MPIAAFPLIYPWAYYLTLALPRYRLPIDPIVMLLLAISIQRLARETIPRQIARNASAIATSGSAQRQ